MTSMTERSIDGGYSGRVTVSRLRARDPEVNADLIVIESELDGKIVLSDGQAADLIANVREETREVACPTWCEGHDDEPDATLPLHRSAVSVVPGFGKEDIEVGLFRFGRDGSDGEARIRIGGQTMTPGQASDVAHHLLQLAALARVS